MPSLARSVPKPLMGNAKGYQPVGTSLFQSSLSTSYSSGCEVKKVKSEVINFLVFDFFLTLICFRGVLNLKQEGGKKVQKIFLMGLKIW